MSVCPYVRKLQVTVFKRKTWNLVHSILEALEKNDFFIFSNFEFLRAFLPPFTPKNVENGQKSPKNIKTGHFLQGFRFQDKWLKI